MTDIIVDKGLVFYNQPDMMVNCRDCYGWTDTELCQKWESQGLCDYGIILPFSIKMRIKEE